jgi:GNAT superfamily N-acetyltransferase
MAAVTRLDGITVRGARPGEGRAIAGLWRELWDAHEAWGGYPASRESRVYDDLAVRLDEDARVRASHPVLGRHVHLVAAVDGSLAGQVEGWFERHGIDPATPFTCEVRSLIVTSSHRKSGMGRALLEALASTALGLARGGSVVLAAEVLEPNPAFSFYGRVRYVPVSWVTRIDANDAVEPAPHAASAYIARIAEPRDALAVAMLESSLAGRRRSISDMRYDRPRAVDATFVSAIAAHLGASPRGPLDALEIVAADRHGSVRASASFAVGSLDAPFVPSRRAVIGRFAVDPALDARPLILPLVAFGCRLARERGAGHVELTDLTPPGTPIYNATLGAGARPWSRIYTKLASP